MLSRFFRFSSIFSIFFAPFVAADLSSAETSTVLALKSSGTLKKVEVQPGTTSAVAYVISPGNISQLMDFVIDAPPGTKVTAKALSFKGNEKKAIKSKKGWFPLTFRIGDDDMETLTVTGDTSSTPPTNTPQTPKPKPTSDFYCLEFTAEQLDKVIAAIKDFSGQIRTRDEICSLYSPSFNNGKTGGNTNGNTSGSGNTFISTQGMTASVILHKDTCAGGRQSKYLVKFDISFAKTGKQARQNAFSMTVAARDNDYNGGMASALKPRSDGRFAPRALFLMTSTGGGYYGFGAGEHVNVVRWRKGKPGIMELPVEDYVYYRGKMLARVVAEPAMGGGRGTVEIHGSGLYSVCFSLSKFRQNLNGY